MSFKSGNRRSCSVSAASVWGIGDLLDEVVNIFDGTASEEEEDDRRELRWSESPM